MRGARLEVLRQFERACCSWCDTPLLNDKYWIEHFLQPQKILVPVLQLMPTPSLHPRPPWIWLLVPFLEISYEWNHTISSFCLLLPGLSIIFSRLIYAAVKINRNPIIHIILWLMLIVPHVEIPACLKITSILPSFGSQRILISYVLVS